MLRLKELREERNLLQKDIAVIINKSVVCVGDWERTRTEPGIEDLIKLADYFDCSVDYLIGREDDLGNYPEKNETTALNADESKLVSTYRKLSKHRQLNLLDVAQGLAQLEKNK